MSYIKTVPIAFVLFAATAVVWASDLDENTEPAKDEVSVSAEPAEDVAGVELDIERFDEESDRRALRDREWYGPRRSLQELLRALEARIDLLRRETQSSKGKGLGVARRMIEKLEKDLERPHQRQNHKRPEHHGALDRGQPHGEIHHRIEHMQTAVRHLKEAHLPEIAEHVEQQIEATRQELRAMHDHDHHEVNISGVLRQVMGQLQDLRHEVGQLREAVNALRNDQ